MKGFVHSTPVPQIYKAAATIAELVQEKGQSIKELVFSKKYSRINTKGLYALIVETLQHESILCDIIRESKILADGRMKPWLARVLITELLWGKKKLPPNDCKPIQAVLDLQSEFIAIVKKAVIDGTHANEPRINKALAKPRYVRVNTLKMTIDEAMDAFVAEGWYRGYPDEPSDYRSFLAKMADIGEMEFVQDFHVPEVFAFPPRTEFYRHELYTSGCLVLQDKATCLAAFLLAPPPGSVVLDMCAAPGLKTTQLAAMASNQGTLYAVEKSVPRYRTLLDFAARHGAEISAVNADASTLTWATVADVEFVLVDPSCSGSGMQRPADDDFDGQRVQKLAGFQVILLERALMNFPSVKRVVYSTCSNFAEENEQVVEKVLKTVNPDPALPNYRLADVLTDSWLNRGSSDYECGSKCLYAKEDVDLTTGFFMAVFERIGSGSFEANGRRKRIRGKKRRELTHKGAEGAGAGTEAGEAERDEDEREWVSDGNVEDVDVKEKRKKKKRKRNDGEENGKNDNENDEQELVSDGKVEDVDVTEKRKKKQRKRNDGEENEKNENEGDERELVSDGEVEDVEVKEKRKKKKRKRNGNEENGEFHGEVVNVDIGERGERSVEDREARRKEKKRRKREMLEQSGERSAAEVNEDVVKRTKKRRSDKEH